MTENEILKAQREQTPPIFDLLTQAEQSYLTNSPDVIVSDTDTLRDADSILFRVHEITYEEEAPWKEALENVLSATRIPGVNFIYLLYGYENEVRFYYGLSRDYSTELKSNLTIPEIGRSVLQASMSGNFRGSEVVELSAAEKRPILDSLKKMKKVSRIEGVAGSMKDDERFQSVDRLVDVMQGERFCLMVVAKALRQNEIAEIEHTLHTAYSALIPYLKYSGQESYSYGTSRSDSTTEGTNESTSTSRSTSVTTQSSSSTANTSGTTESTSTNKSTSVSKQHSTSAANTTGSNESFSKNESKSTGSQTSESTSSGSSRSKTSGHSGTEQTGSGSSWGTSKSNSTTETKGHSDTEQTGSGSSWGTSKSSSMTETKGHSDTEQTGSGSSQGTSTSRSEQMGYNGGQSWSLTTEYTNRCIQEWLKYCDDVVLPRLDYGKGKGLFTSAFYVMTQSASAMTKLENTVLSLYSGKQGNRVPLQPLQLPASEDAGKTIEGQLKSVCHLQMPYGKFRQRVDEKEVTARALLSQMVSADGTFPLGNWITTNELAMIAGLPRKEVVGLRLREEVEFGLNCKTPEDRIKLGTLVQNGRVIKAPVYLDKQALDKHLFISGVTGSGKTTTCQKILLQSHLPFLVIEPAKTEYRILKNNDACDDLLIFTLGDERVAPFRLNPLEFRPEETISSHVDMLKASIEAAFDMEAAIPQVIEAALYRCYEDYGWDINTDENEKYSDPFSPDSQAFPRLSDLLAVIPKVVEAQGFDARLKNDYIGSINARLQSLTVGVKGAMLNTGRSIDWDALLDKKVVFELEGIKNGNEKSLIMGFILSAFNEAVRARYLKEQKQHPHILLVEEAHRLLSRYMLGDSQNKKRGVEIFSDMLAEIRKYGECLIIADQIPNKMAEDVLKNTNTKIVHRIFAQDDKEAIGNTMALSAEQKEFLSNLGPGRAILFSDGIGQAVQMQVEKDTDTALAPLSDHALQERAFRYYFEESERNIFLKPARDIFALPPEQYKRILQFIHYDIPNQMIDEWCRGKKYSGKYAAMLKDVLQWDIFSKDDIVDRILLCQSGFAQIVGTAKENDLRRVLVEFIDTYPKGTSALDHVETNPYF